MIDNSEKTFPQDANLKIDGEVIRRLREEQGLTQLYVAKVVGVTSDTISRWENNRYPRIKTANAQRLAEALETEVDAIVQQPEEEDVAQTPGPAPRVRLNKVRMALTGAGVVVVVAALVLV